MKPRFWGVNIALVLGVLAFLGGISRMAQGTKSADPLAGVIIIVGAIVYKSIKKRRYSLIESTKLRNGVELLGLIFIIVALLFQNNFLFRLQHHPVTNFIIPIWVFIACGIMFFKKIKHHI